MKKFLAILTAFGMVALTMPVLADTNISTGLTRDTSGGANPIVKAKWEANAPDMYTDASVDPGAQFTASGQNNVNKTISVCAIVTDPDGLAAVSNVYADVFYPEGVALGDSHVTLPGQSGLGCGQLMQEDSLNKLSKTDGMNLFCNNVRNHNNDLPTFNSGYNYDEICANDGELMKETAAVYCGTKDLSYEDPSGSYNVIAVATTGTGQQGTLQNSFSYLPTTAFEADFTNVFYGNVRLSIHKIISGNLTWEPTNSTKPTVRNTGNTRLAMQVYQDDMGLGQTMNNGVNTWNVMYDARVGSNATSVSYAPKVWTTLNDPLDLSEMNEMDFSIDVSKFPIGHPSDSYTGNIILSASRVAHLVCGS